MTISIITPHFNDPAGLKNIFSNLVDQSQTEWEWIIVDDCSSQAVKTEIRKWQNSLKDQRIKLIFNDKKSNASVCRNIGAEAAEFDRLIFLDSDDEISADLIKNRQIEFTDFAVFKNTAVKSGSGEAQPMKKIHGHYLNYFLSGRFIWPITAILWDKQFFLNIGKFNSKLPRLQDVELAIRALQNSSSFTVLDNEVDFFYNVKPIRSRKNFLKPVCDAVHILVSELIDPSELSEEQKKLLSGYYYLCTKYLERSEDRSNTHLVKKNLRLFNKLKYIKTSNYIIGLILLQLYRGNIINGKTFLNFNRYLFKPVEELITLND